MKSIVICCALAICLEFVASVPYTTHSQRYSGLNAGPVPEPSYQYPPRPYFPNQQYNGGAYRAPIQTQQEQQLPNVNRNYHFSRKQESYQPKGPPQPEIFNEKYINQQNVANDYYNRHVQEIRHEVPQYTGLPLLPPQKTNPQFLPAIPVIPAVPQSTRGALEHGNEVQLPIIKPAPQVEYPSVRAVSDVERFMARSADPVELIPQPVIPQRPSVELMLSHPRIREVLATAAKKTRFLVIHPDGTFEHVDSLQNVAEKHPNYVLVHAGDIPNLRRTKPVSATPLPQVPSPVIYPTKVEEHQILSTVPTEAALADQPYPAIAAVQNEVTQPIQSATIITNPLPAIAEVQTEVAQPVQSATIIDNPLPAIAQAQTEVAQPVQSATKIDNLLPATAEVQNEAPQPVQLLQDHHEEPAPVIETIVEPVPVPPVNAPEVVTAEVVVPPTDSVDTAPQALQSQPTDTNVAKEVISPNDDNNVTKIAGSESPSPTNSLAVSSPVEHVLGSLKDLAHKIIEENAKKISDTAVNIDPSRNEPVQSPESEEQRNGPALVKDALNQVLEALSKSLTPIDDNCTTVENVDNNQQLTNDTPESLDSYKEIMNHLSGADPNETPHILTPRQNEEIPNLGDLDITKVPTKPSVWFNTSDPKLWGKLADKEQDIGVVYFFEIHNQPKIEKDIKTTIHPNGTIVEDTIETTWAFEGDEPTITKSTKVIHPEDQ